MSSTGHHLQALETPALIVHEVGSIHHLIGNIDCSWAVENFKSPPELLYSKTLHNLIALLLLLLQCLASSSVITCFAIIAVTHAHGWA